MRLNISSCFLLNLNQKHLSSTSPFPTLRMVIFLFFTNIGSVPYNPRPTFPPENDASLELVERMYLFQL